MVRLLYHTQGRTPRTAAERDEFLLASHRPAANALRLRRSAANAPPIFCRPWLSTAKRKPRFYAIGTPTRPSHKSNQVGTACVVHDHDEQYHERRKNDSKDKMNGTTNVTDVLTKGTLTGVTTKGAVTVQHDKLHGD